MLYPTELRAEVKTARAGAMRTGNLVGVERFELPTSCSQSRRATGLRYTPREGESYRLGPGPGKRRPATLRGLLQSKSGPPVTHLSCG